MKILAVSDISNKGLEQIAEKSPGKLKKLDLIISCGDLDKEYVELLVDGLNKDFYFVCGNHDHELVVEDEEEDLWGDRSACTVAGKYELHGKIEKYKNYYIVGFGGSLWYGGNGYEYREYEMAAIVKKVKRKLQWNQLKDKIAGRPKKDVIVISHSPIFGIHNLPDLPHTGFKCFADFLKKISPVLWLHGHVHLDDLHKNQVTIVGKTTVVNAYSHKYINLGPKEIKISYSPVILDT